MSSWKTTIAGIAAAIATIASAVGATFDNDPSTVADWGIVTAALAAAYGLIKARDNDKTSEDVGAKK